MTNYNRINKNHTIFLFLLSLFFLVLSINIQVSSLTIICFFLIATVGVSHGSLDHIKGRRLLKILKIKSKTFFVVEMPDYKLPSLKNVFFDVIEKTKAFIFGAGKIILSISIVLWFLASNGPQAYTDVEKNIIEKTVSQEITEVKLNQMIASSKLENSYIGIMGKSIEPAIKPLG